MTNVAYVFATNNYKLLSDFFCHLFFVRCAQYLTGLNFCSSRRACGALPMLSLPILWCLVANCSMSTPETRKRILNSRAGQSVMVVVVPVSPQKQINFRDETMRREFVTRSLLSYRNEAAPCSYCMKSIRRIESIKRDHQQCKNIKDSIQTSTTLVVSNKDKAPPRYCSNPCIDVLRHKST